MFRPCERERIPRGMCCEDHLAQEVGIQIAGGNRCRQSGFRHFGYEALSGEVVGLQVG